MSEPESMAQEPASGQHSLRTDIFRLGRKSAAYTIGFLATRAISFLLLPLYTNALTPADYGVLTLAFTFAAFSLIVFHFGIDSSLLRYYTGAERPRQTEVFTTVYLTQLVVAVLLAGVLLLAREPLANLLLGVQRPDWMALLIGIIFFDALWAHPMHVRRAEGRAKTFATLSLMNAILLMTGNIVLVAGYGLGITGALISNLIASFFLLLINLPTIWRNLSYRRFSSVTLKALLRFGLPFLPAGLFTMIMELSDRYFLRWMTDMETVGLYSAGYKLGLFVLLLIGGFNLGWQPFFLERGKSPHAPQVFARIATYLLAALAWVVLTLSAWVDDLVRLPLGSITIFGPQYWSATNIVPLILLGYFFFAAYVLQLPGVQLTSKTRWVMVFRGSGAAAKLALNLLLIPIWGAMGAATATCLAFAVMTTVTFVISRRLYPVPYEWGRLMRVIVILATGFTALYLFPAGPLRNSLLTIWMPLGFILSGGITSGEWRQLRRLAGRS
ncbi:MAG: lipopolysaccharide biosynthesis protein [Candidatus Marinimicrobia bacterium]|nr:lipopolysaccharide biosynthesis protein [Candidatus Neomarinimicrobiota bacterium]